jgi:3',5'-cyclic AMP phosphodiesterase CpdA
MAHARIAAERRHLVLPPRGTLIVNTDVHGNGEDFRAVRDHFLAALARDPGAHWVILGDVVHAPDARARQEEPALYDYPDESGAIVREILALTERHPGHVHFVLGNHDYGHVGGLHTRKFHPDEVAHLEATLDDTTRAALRTLCGNALLAVAAPCGVLLTHGSPDATIGALADLDAITLPPDPENDYHARALAVLLNCYGQPGDVSARALAKLSTPEVKLTVVIHGHDRDESGWFTEGGNQLCPVIFGAPRANKRYVELDLAARYPDVRALRDGEEIRRVHG